MGRWLTTWPKPLVLTISKAHLASGSRPTSPWAGVLAVVLLARQGSRAVSIVLTFSLPAHYIRVAKVPRGTPALSHGTSWKAFSVHPARSVVPTRVDPLTTGDCVRHRAETFETFANGVSLSIHVTPGVLTARGGKTGVWRRSSGLRSPLASSDCVGHGAEPRLAGAHWVALNVHVALRVPPTGARNTRVWSRNTLVVAANHPGPAVGVPLALPAASGDGVRHRDVGVQASADRVPCPAHRALCVWAAGTRVARIRLLDAPLVLADQPLLAVGVSDALRSATGDCVWFGNETRLTSTDRIASKIGSADGPWAAGTWHAGVGFDNTPLAPADITLLAVWVSHTLRLAPSDGVRVGNKTGLTATDCVACSVHHALRSRTAGAGNAGVGLLDTALVSADLASKAVGVSDTLRAAASDCVGLGHQPGLTSADCVARVCCHTP